MKQLESYKIPLLGVKKGKQDFDFLVDKVFIECFDDVEIKDSEVQVQVSMNKLSQTFEFNFKLKGTVLVECDRCLDDLNLKISGTFNLYLKFGESYEELDDNIVMVPRDEGYFDLSPFVYEYVKLSMPISKLHKKKECNHEMVKILENIKHKESNNNEIDPRWDALKKLGNNN